MSSLPQMQNISGQISVAGLPAGAYQFPFGLSIELSSQVSSVPGDPGNWIGTAAINNSGSFSIATAYAVSNNETVQYRIYNGQLLLQQSTATISSNTIAVSLDTSVYNDLIQPDPMGCITIKGNVTIGAGNTRAVPVPAANISVAVYMSAFPDSVQIAKTTIDAYGNYCIKVSYKLLLPLASPPVAPPASCGSVSLSPFFVALVNTDTSNTDVILVESMLISQADAGCMEIDLHSDDTNIFPSFYTELEYLTNIITATTKLQADQLYTITTDGENPDLNKVIALSGLDSGPVSNIINAAKISHDTGIFSAHTYALTKAQGADISAWANQDDLSAVTEIINTAAANHIIPAGGNINDTYTRISEQKTDDLVAVLTDNGNTLGSTIAALTGSDNDARTFLELDALYGSTSAGAFWEQVEINLPGQSAILQQGLQVLALTGMQPEITKELMAVLTAEGGGRIPAPTSFLTTYVFNDWQTLIANTCDKYSKLCVPQAVIDQATANGTDPKNVYANKLLTVTADLFATTVINNLIQNDAAFKQALGDQATQIQDFLTANPNFDFRVNNVWDIDPAAIPDVAAARKVLAPIQNVMRLTAGKPAAAAALLKDGIRSSVDIAAMPQESFVANYSTVLGGDSFAQGIYTQASQTALVMTNIQTTVTADIMANPLSIVLSGLNSDWIIDIYNNAPVNTQSPDLVSLFGNIDACSCTECTSMYSPAAYYADILNFIRTMVGTVSGTGSTALTELKRRRPDLVNIDLSCKNSNTPLPYTDLVNEILERKILDFINHTAIGTSYQTGGTAAELAAYPEHTIKANAIYQKDNSYQAVYNDTLKNAIYPNTVPFNLALEEGRTFFRHLGFTRYDLMQQYKPGDFNTAADTQQTINTYNADAEWLNISKFETDIITQSTAAVLAIPTWKYYGFDLESNNDYEINNSITLFWYEQLCNNISPLPTVTVSGLQTLLDRASISYRELLQFLSIDTLNPKLSATERTLEIIAVNASATTTTGQDTCDLGRLKLVYGDDTIAGSSNAADIATVVAAKKTFFKKLHRFVRMCRATGWSIYQLDMVLESLGVTDIDTNTFKAIAAVHQLSIQLNTAPEKLSAFWHTLSITRYTNYDSDNQGALPSVYDSLFRNKAIVNPGDPVFDYGIPGTPTPPPDAPFGAPYNAISYTAHKGTLLAATGITEAELDILYSFVSPSDTTLTFTSLCRVYALSVLASGLGVTVADLMRILQLYHIESAVFAGTAAAIINDLQAIVIDRQQIAATPFTLDETDYLQRHQDVQSVYTPAAAAMEQFYESLRSDLKKQYDKDSGAQTVNKDTLGNIVIREFSTAFNIDGSIAKALLQGITAPGIVSGTTDTQAAILNIPVATPTPVLTSLLDVLTNSGFINSSDDISTAVNSGATLALDNGLIHISDLYNAYILSGKIALLVNRLGISGIEFAALLMGDTTVKDSLGTVINTIPSLRTTFGFPVLENMPVAALQNPLTGSVQAFLSISGWMQLSNRLNLINDDFTGLLEKIAGIPQNGINGYITALGNATGWNETTLHFLLGGPATGTEGILVAGVTALTNFIQPSLLAQTADIMDAAKRLGLSPDIIYPALKADLILDQSQLIRQAAKAKYTDAQWAVIAKPLQDVLREKQRAALVAYTVANPDIGDPNVGNTQHSTLRWKNANDLFAYYLIDVEMKPVMLTSRIKQAISSLQLYMLRIIQNLENTNGVTTTHININLTQVVQWETWRKWYRVWEANREVFLYPENWMEPSLRDDKTSIFKTLETQLQQNEVTAETAEDALRAYLEDLDVIARLEPVSAYHQLEKDSTGKVTVDIKHVFGRTNSEPQRYYYRTLQNNIWSPWEKMNINIKSDHVTPVMWNRRLYLYWATFTPKQSKKWYRRPPAIAPLDDPDYRMWSNRMEKMNNGVSSNKILTIVVDDNRDDKEDCWDIKLNWTQYKDGKWLAAEMCNDTMQLEPSQFILTAKERDAYNAYQPNDLQFPFFSDMTKNGDQKLADLFKNRLYLSPFFIGNDENNPLILTLIFFSRPDDCGAITLNSFILPDPVSQPYVERAWERQYVLLSPIGTHANGMKFHEITAGNQSAGRKLKIEGVAADRDQHFSYFYLSNKSNTNGPYYYFRRKYGTAHTTLLASRPYSYGAFRLTKFANATGGNNYIPDNSLVPDNNNPNPNNTETHNNYSVIQDYFFYEDDKNTYYVQRNPTSLGQVLGTLGASTLMAGIESTIPGGSSSAAPANITLTAVQQAASANYTPVLSGPSAANLNGAGIIGLAGQSPASSPSLQILGGTGTLLSVALYDYHFQTFYHAQIHQFLLSLNKDGIPGLLKSKNQQHTDDMHFGPLNAGNYQPTTAVNSDYPGNNVQFAATDPYSIYNWEIFFHAPMLIAQQLSDNQQFEDAQKWYHYIFDPTSSTDGFTGSTIGTVKRFWKFFPFYNIATATPQTLTDLVVALATLVNNNSNNSQVSAMQNDPFNPFVIGRMRNLAFMKNVVMKYLDNLIAWGDQLFRQDTIESINEATQLYILAANILGRRPETIPPRAASAVYTFQELLDASGNNLGPLSDPMVYIESFFGPNTGIATGTAGTGPGAPPVYGKMLYFCIPSNDILLGYWDTVADRLFKIRNSMNIEGVLQQLPIYDPPIDPALLVRARAMGIDIASIVDATLSGASTPSNYRFSYMLAKANEFCGEVRALGGALLSALEKKDAEGLALLRSSQEVNLLDQITFIKQNQVDEAQAALDALNLTKEVTQIRYDYYSSRQFTNNYEQQHLQSIQTGLVLQAIQGGLEGTAATLSVIPNAHIQGFATGTSIGGSNFAAAIKAISTALGIATAINNGKGAMASTMGGYQRRSDDWVFQANSASKELEQLDRQILGAQIRLDIANRELKNHELQLKNSTAVDEYMRNKFTNEDLYTWMSGQLASTYFKAYQLAYDLAKKADNCYHNELPVSTKYPAGGFVTFGYWDSLKKGLLSGENLQFDLRRMEAAYLDDNVRELELTKSISLAMTDPETILNLRNLGYCYIYLPEEIFDLDYPGHYLRRIKSISISIPCIAGPYTTIPATLTLKESYTRMKDAVVAPTLDPPSNIGQAIATSSAQNDSGMFELNFRDERYLPFEGKGAISKWELSLTAFDDTSGSGLPAQVRVFDFNTISDVILHLRYTARTGEGNTLKSERITNINNKLKTPSGGTGVPASLILPRYFSLKHEFSNEWYAGFNQVVNVTGVGNIGRPMNMILKEGQFPEYCQGGNITTVTIELVARFNTPQDSANVKYYIKYGTVAALLAPDPDGATYNNAKVSFNTPAITITATDAVAPNFSFILYKTDENDNPILDSNQQPETVSADDLVDLYFIVNYKLQ